MGGEAPRIGIRNACFHVRSARGYVLAAIVQCVAASTGIAQSPVFDGDAIPAPLTAAPGDSARGKKVVVEREKGHCILCHALPESDVRFAGHIGPPLNGVAHRLDAAQIRGRIADPTKHDPQTVMPAYYRTDGLRRVARQYAGKTVLSAQDVEDAVAYLSTLR
jgi:sulfur-oxidizing protein SoxX